MCWRSEFWSPWLLTQHFNNKKVPFSFIFFITVQVLSHSVGVVIRWVHWVLLVICCWKCGIYYSTNLMNFLFHCIKNGCIKLQFLIFQYRTKLVAWSGLKRDHLKSSCLRGREHMCLGGCTCVWEVVHFAKMLTLLLILIWLFTLFWMLS